MSQQAISPAPVFTEAGAHDNAVVAREAQEWIEEVTGKTFGASFRESLKDGVLLCELMRKINPGSILRINNLKSPIAHLDNIQQFLNACRDLGMKESQLFDTMDLQSSQVTPKKIGVKRDDSDRKIRSVCVTLYWLGKTVAEMGDYSGPRLDLSAFSSLLQGTQGSDDEDSTSSPIFESHDHYQLELDNHGSSPELPATNTVENGIGLTFEQEQTADQLLADIQSAVDEMLHDFQFAYIPEETPGEPLREIENRIGVTVHMVSRNGGFGFQVIGGADANYHPEVELVLPGSAAEDAGIQSGDQIVSVNKKDVTRLCHDELISLIKKAGSEGSMLIGLMRQGCEPPHTQQHTVSDIQELLPNSKQNEDILENEEYLLDTSNTPLRAPPMTTYGGQPLPPLVEYQEEAMLEQITEMLEKSPPPPDSPSLPLVSTYLSPTQAHAPTFVADDRASIERDLQEIVLMEVAATTKQPQDDESPLKNQDIDEELNIDDEIEELLSFGRASKSPQFKNNSDLDLLPSPPPPKPTTEAPKRQVKKALPPPIKAKPNRPASFVQTTTLSSEPELVRARSATPTLTTQPLVISPLPDSQSPAPPTYQSLNEAVSTHSLTQEPDLDPAFVPSPITQTSPVTTEILSPQPLQPTSINAPSPQPVHTVTIEPSSQPEQSSLTTESLSPQPSQTTPVTIDTPSQPQTVTIDTPPIAAPQLSPTKITELPSSIPLNTQSTEDSTIMNTPRTPTSQPLQVKELGTVTPDDVEIVGNATIRQVRRTRWTPKGSSTETVSSTDEQNKVRLQQHFTQMWANTVPKHNGYPEPVRKATTPGAQIGTSSQLPHSEPSKRHTQSGGMASWQNPLGQEDRNLSASSNVLSTPHQYMSSNTNKKPNWKSQEELRIKRNTTSNGHLNQWRKSTPVRQQSMPAQQFKTQSLPRGTTDNWRVNRNNTWSRGIGQRPMDGQQSAYAMKAKSPYDLCSRCHKPLGTETIMIIPNLRAQYHVSCFVCRLCRAPLVRSPHNTAVFIKGMHPHCKYCSSTDQGVITTEC